MLHARIGVIQKVYLHVMGRKYVVREMAHSPIGDEDWYHVGVRREGTIQYYSVSPTYKKPATFRLSDGMPISIAAAYRMVNELV
jgi:hypothetical protein